MTRSKHDPILTGREEYDGVRTAEDGDLEEVRRVVYFRATDKTGFCPFCESAEGVKWDTTSEEHLKRRSGCECGASGNYLWTWDAGTVGVSE